MRSISRNVAIPIIAMLAAACGGGGATTAPTSAATQPPAGTSAPSGAVATGAPATQSASTCRVPAAGEATVVESTVVGFAWQDVTAKVGDVITWTNGDTEPHGVETDDGTCRQDPPTPGNGTASLVFDVAGTYPFICWLHPTMTGTITITQ
jgi:plastocyanin